MKARIPTGEIVLLDFYCPALDTQTRECTIYPWRHGVGVEPTLGFRCLTAEQDIAIGGHPRDCPYQAEDAPGLVFDSVKVETVPHTQYMELWRHACGARHRILMFVELRNTGIKPYQKGGQTHEHDETRGNGQGGRDGA